MLKSSVIITGRVRLFSVLAASLLFVLFFQNPEPVKAGTVPADSPLAPAAQAQIGRAEKLMKSGKYDKAKLIIEAALESANDVPKCLAVAGCTEAYAFPMMETRRKCCNKALSLCSSEDDYLLMALKARRYQFFEITRDCINKLIENAGSVQALYGLARKAHEISLNDLAHLAMERAVTGLKADDWLTYVENCKQLGMDDLMRKALKKIIDDSDDSIDLCETARVIQRYGMRDLVRYALRKALDKVSPDLPTATREMEEIAEAARQLNEPDVKARADFYVSKGHLLLKQQGTQTKDISPKEAAPREKSGFSDSAAPLRPPGKPSDEY